MKLLVLLAARDGEVDRLLDDVRDASAHIASGLPTGSQIALLRRLDDDPLARFQPAMRPFEVALELAVGDPADGGDGFGRLLEASEGLGSRLQDRAHLDLSVAAAGSVLSVLPPSPARYRYLYLMRRKAGTTHEQYVDHYEHVHAEFGRRTPAICGYEQFYLDESSSRAFAQGVGLGGCLADSVSELSIPDMAAFMQGVATSTVGREGPMDERNFVDRANSVGCSMEVLDRRAV